MALFSGVADLLDTAGGSVDESIGRQFDSDPGGGTFDGRSEAWEPSDGMGNRWLRGETARRWYDTVMGYDGTLNGSTDTVDLLGPTAWGMEGSVADVLADRQGEQHGASETKTKLLLWLLVFAVGLYLLAPILQLGATLAGGEDG